MQSKSLDDIASEIAAEADRVRQLAETVHELRKKAGVVEELITKERVHVTIKRSGWMYADFVDAPDSSRDKLNEFMVSEIERLQELANKTEREAAQKTTFTIEEFRAYLETQDSRGDIYSNLSEENVRKASEVQVQG